MARLERDFQATLIKQLKVMFPGCMVLKNDPNYLQGVPDLTIFFRDRWATLECKKTPNEVPGPNQRYYVAKMNDMSYSSFIFPENKDQVLDELCVHFK